MTSDSFNTIHKSLESNQVFVFTPEKLDFVLRKADQSFYNTCVNNFVNELSLILVDECHFIGDERRGSTLEIVLNRLKMMSRSRILALSATIPN